MLRGICMVPATLSLIPFLALTLWRFVFTRPRGGWLVREIDAPRPRQNGLLGQGLHILDPTGLAVIVGNRFEGGSIGLEPLDRKDRAKTYLRRIVALTGTTQTDSGYVLDVGTTRFQVRDRYVRRVQDVTNPKCAYEGTCFIPRAKRCQRRSKL